MLQGEREVRKSVKIKKCQLKLMLLNEEAKIAYSS